MHACGVCHTDLHTVEGELEPHRSPVVPGHQIVGEVVAFGDWPGELQRPWPRPTAGRWSWASVSACRGCGRRTGLPLLPAWRREPLRPRALHRLRRGWRLRRVRRGAGRLVYRLPAGMDDLDGAPLLCAGIIGYRCLRLTGVVGRGLPGGRAAMAPSGRLAPKRLAAAPRPLRLWRRRSHLPAGCRAPGWEVYVFTRGSGIATWRWSWARSGPAAVASHPAATTPMKLDAAIVFAPAGELALDALEAARQGRIVALGGIHSSPIPPIEYQYHLRGARAAQRRQRHAPGRPRLAARRTSTVAITDRGRSVRPRASQ